MGARVLYEDHDTFNDGSRYEMIATSIPKCDDYPDGVKYRFQYMAEDGRTLLRFDNFPDHPGVERHHYPTPEGVHDDIEYTYLKNHIQSFYKRMDDLRGR